MLNHAHMARYEQASLDNLHASLQTWLETIRVSSAALLELARVSIEETGRCAERQLAGEIGAPLATERLVVTYQSACRDIVTAHAAWLDTLAQQAHLDRERAHKLFGEAGTWVPKAAELALRSADIVSDAWNQSLEGVAEATCEATAAFADPDVDLVVDTPPAPTTPRIARRKAA
ncbi:MAG: hypothetical protein KDH20_08995 [Rhodocyclaceae bacterium]|nr:hypothetical protein [Rhodocyclaceae bacterium]